MPEDLMGFRFVFEKTASERLPEHKPWDHATDLKPDLPVQPCKVYPLSPTEQDALDAFLKARGIYAPLELADIDQDRADLSRLGL